MANAWRIELFTVGKLFELPNSGLHNSIFDREYQFVNQSSKKLS